MNDDAKRSERASRLSKNRELRSTNRAAQPLSSTIRSFRVDVRRHALLPRRSLFPSHNRRDALFRATLGPATAGLEDPQRPQTWAAGGSAVATAPVSRLAAASGM